jgi:hypothetical protein
VIDSRLAELRLFFNTKHVRPFQFSRHMAKH